MEMNEKMELLTLLRKCKSAEEWQALAQEHGCPLTHGQTCVAFDEKNKQNM